MASVRERLLDAAWEAAVAGTWHGVPMADLSARAGVSRQTLYNEFGSKDGLAAALAMREAERLLAGVGATMTNRPDPAAAVAAAVDWSLAEAASNPLVKAALIDDAGGLLPWLTTRSGAVLESLRDGLAATLLQSWPALDPDQTTWVAEVAVRLTVSHLVVPTEPAAVTVGHVQTVVRRLLPTPTT
jgi:AcrR family transcriptional regulator